MNFSHQNSRLKGTRGETCQHPAVKTADRIQSQADVGRACQQEADTGGCRQHLDTGTLRGRLSPATGKNRGSLPSAARHTPVEVLVAKQAHGG